MLPKSAAAATSSSHKVRRVIQLGLLLVAVYVLATFIFHTPPEDSFPSPELMTARPSRPPPSPRHRYGPDGLLEVNTLGPHPIYELIARAEALWNAKVAKQSRTLKQAVQEYRRRYGRYPPPGFDAWWEYTEQHNVQLRDDYHQIFLSLLGFWGVRPSELRSLRDNWATGGGGSYTIGKQTKEQKVRVLHTTSNSTIYQYHSNLQLNLIKDIEHLLPPFAATFNPQDNPVQLASYAWRRETTLHSMTNEDYAGPIQAENVDGWLSTCGPHTPYRSSPPANETQSSKKTFIYDHIVSRDPCSYPAPSHFGLHGIFIQHDMPGHPGKLGIPPTFSVCNTGVHADILAATPYLWVEDENDPPFSQKNDTHLLWRGSITGSDFVSVREYLLEKSQRPRLVLLANRNEGHVPILNPTPNMHTPVGEPKLHNFSDINPAMMDVSFTGEPIQCQEPICDKMAKMFEFKEFLSEKDQGKYKYIIDVDGNGWSGRFQRLMTTHSLIFKSTLYYEWFSDRIMPWVHYVPIQLDYSDLYDALAFFHGSPGATNAHEHMAEKIAHAGREWSKKYFRKEDMTAYMFRLYLEYARVMSDDREKLEFRM